MRSSIITVSKAQISDISEITDIYRQAVLVGKSSWEYDPPNTLEMTQRFEMITMYGFPYLVAKKNNRVVGFAYASKYRDRIGYRFCVENSVYIDPAHHSQGIGSQLLDALINECTNLGFKQMIAVIGDSENRASIKLHEKSGFVQVGFLPKIGFKFDIWLDSIIMQRKL
jgi:phosphinothricin acetyltransferase